MSFSRYSDKGIIDYAGLCVNGNLVESIIPLTQSWVQFDLFAQAGAEKKSQSDLSTNSIIIGASKNYQVAFNVAGTPSGNNHIFEFIVFEVSGTQVTITDATAANPVVITAATHGFSDGDQVKIANVGGMVELNNRIFTIGEVTANTFELQDDLGSDIDGISFTAYTSGGTVSKAISTFIHSIRKFAAGDIGSVSAQNFILLTIDNRLELYFKNLSAISGITADSANLSMHRLG